MAFNINISNHFQIAYSKIGGSGAGRGGGNKRGGGGGGYSKGNVHDAADDRACVWCGKRILGQAHEKPGIYFIPCLITQNLDDFHFYVYLIYANNIFIRFSRILPT